MKKVLFFLITSVSLTLTASAQKDTTKVIDNKGTVKWVISSSAAVVTKADSTLLFVTPKQLNDSGFIKLASNGLTKNGQTAELGGTLTKATTIQTSATNTLKISGLESGSLATDSLVVSTSDGTLKRVNAETLLQSGSQNFTTTAGQTSFAVANMPASATKVWVYRNGAKLIPVSDFTTTAGQVTLTSAIGAVVVAGDNIEVQWVK